jgi:hypothetical protein
MVIIENSPNKVKLMVSLRRKEFKRNLRSSKGEQVYRYGQQTFDDEEEKKISE